MRDNSWIAAHEHFSAKLLTRISQLSCREYTWRFCDYLEFFFCNFFLCKILKRNDFVKEKYQKIFMRNIQGSLAEGVLVCKNRS